MKRLWAWFLKASLWIASAGLMLASSGLDGAYLSKLMPDGWGWLGLVLNTVADVTSEVGMYWYGRLKMDKSSVKQDRAKWILLGQAGLIFYAWLFGWRQLVPKIAIVDPGALWMAPVGAVFVPMAIAVVGYILSVLAGRIETAKIAPIEQESAKPAPIVTPEPPMLTVPERRERVLAAMLADEPPTQAVLAVELGVGRSTIGNDVTRLRKVGKLNGQRGH